MRETTSASGEANAAMRFFSPAKFRQTPHAPAQTNKIAAASHHKNASPRTSAQITLAPAAAIKQSGANVPRTICAAHIGAQIAIAA